jgi:hypothetical protein
MLSIPCYGYIYITTPIFRINSLVNIPMKTGIRPLAYLGDKAMLNRIHMSIINIAFEVFFVAYQMLPKMTLPNTSLPSRLSNAAPLLGLR